MALRIIFLKIFQKNAFGKSSYLLYKSANSEKAFDWRNLLKEFMNALIRPSFTLNQRVLAMRKNTLFIFFALFLSLAALSKASAAEETKIFKQDEAGNLIAENEEISQFGIDTTTFAEAESPSYGGALIKMIIVLVIIIILMGITFYSFKKIVKNRTQSANNSKAIKILERRILSPKSALYLIEVNKEKVLISESHVEVRPIQALELDQKET